jgi:sugar phosphate isomerase/epimerase
MRKLAYSTVACHDWTLDRAITLARESGLDGIELRTFGYGSPQFACDPAMTSPKKTLGLLRNAGVDAVSVATSIRLDAPIRPRIIGRVIGDQERAVREAKAMIDLAAQIEAPYIRLFGFESPKGESMKSTFKLVVSRLRMITDHAHRTGVKVAFEIGGSFTSPEVLEDLLGAVDNRLLGLCWNVPVAHADGHELPPALARRTLILRLADGKRDERRGSRWSPCPLGEGEVPMPAHTDPFRSFAPKDAVAVFEWPRAWQSELDAAETVIPAAAAKMADWLAQPARALV